MAKYDLTVEHEGHVKTFVADDDAEAVEAAEDLIASGDYDLADGETIQIRYWLTREGCERDDGHSVEIEG